MDDVLAFIVEIDKLKSVLRKTKVMTGDRHENSAEHSWHLAMMAIVLAPHSVEPVNVGHVVEMLLIHDLVEIDAGDVFIYDETGYESKRAKEEACADRLFGMLEPEIGKRLRVLWEEFESQTTPESRFAASLDRIQPILANLRTEGYSWVQHGITLQQVLDKNGFASECIPGVWNAIKPQLDQAVERGWLKS